MDIDQPSVVDSPPSNRFPIYTRANITDVWPGPATPLVFTTTSGKHNDVPWRKALVRLGAFDLTEFEHEEGELLAVFYGYPYLNVSAPRVYGLRTPGANPDLVDQAFFGTGGADVPPYRPDQRDESPEHTERIVKVIGDILAVEELPYFDGARERILAARATRPDLATASNEDLYEYALRYTGTWWEDELEEHMYLISASAIPLGIIQSVAVGLGDPGLSTRVLGGQGEVDSAAPSWALWELSRLVLQSRVLTKIFDEGVPGVGERLQALDDPDVHAFRRRFAEFLSEFGSRCANEYELSALSWETDPTVPLTAIDRMRLQPDEVAPRAGLARLAADREAATSVMFAQLAEEGARVQLQAALRSAQVFLRARERSKTNLILMLHEARLAFQEIGRRMLAAGHLSALSDFTMLRLDEFPAFLTDPPAWSKEISARSGYYAALAELEAPFVTEGVPSPPSTWPRRTEEHPDPAVAGEVIRGIGACAGTATGRARIVLDPVAVGELEPGEILVCPATDPSWTPLFLAAVAVVVDVGAPLSHASIVSRELGIPCVVSARHASRRIRDGAVLTVDGANGTVTVVST